MDDFVVVESTLTFSGKPRAPLRPDRRTMFAGMAGRLHCFVADDPPRDPDPWVGERSQREAIWRLGVASLASADEDLVIISAADEVPCPEVVDKLALAISMRRSWCGRTGSTSTGAPISGRGITSRSLPIDRSRKCRSRKNLSSRRGRGS